MGGGRRFSTVVAVLLCLASSSSLPQQQGNRTSIGLSDGAGETSGDETSCWYRFTQQPPRYLPCNPYTSGRLVASCEVSFDHRADGGDDEPIDFHLLQWVFTPANLDLYRTDNKYTLSGSSFNSSTNSTSISSQLNVELLSEADIGFYHCQVQFKNGSVSERSQSLDLFSHEIFDGLSLSPCSEFTPQAVREESCVFAVTMASSPPSSDDVTADKEGWEGVALRLVFVAILLLNIGAFFCAVSMKKKCSEAVPMADIKEKSLADAPTTA